LILKSSHRQYVNVEFFLDSIKTVFLPYLVWLRGLARFSAEDEILLMDNCSAHITDHAIHLLTAARIPVITFAPHTTQILQVLDLMLFRVLKRRPRYELPFENDTAAVEFITNFYHDFKRAMVPPNVWGAFDALGLDFDTRREP
jgi:hypothetical protein